MVLLLLLLLLISCLFSFVRFSKLDFWSLDLEMLPQITRAVESVHAISTFCDLSFMNILTRVIIDWQRYGDLDIWPFNCLSSSRMAISEDNIAAKFENRIDNCSTVMAYFTSELREHCDLDLWPIDLKIVLWVGPAVMNQYTEFELYVLLFLSYKHTKTRTALFWPCDLWLHILTLKFSVGYVLLPVVNITIKFEAAMWPSVHIL